MASGAVLESRIPEIVADMAAKMDGVAKAGADLVEATAREKAPYDYGKPASEPHLRDAIHTEKEKPGEYSVVAGDGDVFWGLLVENGTSKNPPHPFLVPSLEEDKPEIQALASAALKSL